MKFVDSYQQETQERVWPDDPEERGMQKCYWGIYLRSIAMHGTIHDPNLRERTGSANGLKSLFILMFIVFVFGSIILSTFPEQLAPRLLFVAIFGFLAYKIVYIAVAFVKFKKMGDELYDEGAVELRQMGVDPPPKRSLKIHQLHAYANNLNSQPKPNRDTDFAGPQSAEKNSEEPSGGDPNLPGWYPDPLKEATVRWFDGENWTENKR